MKPNLKDFPEMSNQDKLDASPTALYDHIVSIEEWKLAFEKQVQEMRVSILGMFCQQGPPTKHWIDTEGKFWKGWNACLDKILGVGK